MHCTLLLPQATKLFIYFSSIIHFIDGLAAALTGAVPMRNSPTLATSVEEAERSKILELVQQLPTSFRMPLDRMLDSLDSDRYVVSMIFF